MKISTSIRGKLAGCYLAFFAVLCVIGWTSWTTGSRLNQLAADFGDRNDAAVNQTRRTVAKLVRPDTGNSPTLAAGIQHEMDGLLGGIDASIDPASPAKAREAAAARMRTAVADAQAKLLKLAQTPQEKPDSSAIDRALAGMAEQFQSSAAAYRSGAAGLIEIYHMGCVILVAGIALAALILFTASRSILARLWQVAAIATALAEDSLDSAIVTDGRDEISRALSALSAMQKKLSNDRAKLTDSSARLHFALVELETRERELEKHKVSLDKLVAERTAELAENNEQLKNEIARRHKTEQELVAAKELADAANRTKSQFLANMSHEIRTPMNGVIGMVDLLRQTGLAPRQDHFATVIRQSARALLTIINDLLDFSKIEAGELTLDISTVDLRACADDVANLLAGAAQKQGIELTYIIADSVPQLVRGDLARIRQILVNLVGNAIKFTNQGDVALRIEAFPMGMSGELTRVRFDIRDTGIGIPKEAIKGIFEAFRQVDDGTNRRFEGTGLGLSIVQQLVKIMGGRVEVESEVGKGSLFRVELTLAVSRPRERTAASLPLSFEGKRALVVDDSEASRALIQHYLSKLRIAGTSAGSGDAAFEALSRADRSGRPYDLAIVDAVMPGTSGGDIVRRIRANAETVNLPVLILTSLGPAACSVVEADIENVASLTKPIREADFCEHVANLLTENPLALNRFTPTSRVAATDEAMPQWPALHLRALLVEDSPINQEIAREHLTSFGCRVDAVSDGEAALVAFAAHDYDVIVMDCLMPGVDGFEAARRIREREAANGVRRRVPIIALTALASTTDRERCRAAGMDDCLTKPFEPADLYRMIECCAIGRANAASAQTPQLAVLEPAEASAVLDLKAIQALKRAPGANGSGLLDKVGRLFLEATPIDLADLASAIEGNAADRVAGIAHKLKSASRNIGATELAELLKDLEDNASAGRLCDAHTSLRHIHTQFERTILALRREMTEAAA
ncbi:MAG TPA: response regulator [Xanthobacteraceae bacterium]|nr:response regulator [Xanthobacteraceae bacterium]